MKGFFSKKETESVSAVGGKIHSCVSCGLYKNCKNPKMKPYGNFKKGIIVLGEKPSKSDDQSGKPFQGKEGRFLKKALDDLGIDLFEDCLSLNAINCAPKKEELPTTLEIDHCRSVIVWKALQSYQPKVIIVLGGSALQSVIGHRWSGSASIHKFQGFTIPDQDLKAWVCPTFSIDSVMKSNKKDLYNIWNEDLEKAIQKVEEPFLRSKKPEIEVVKDLRFLDTYPKDHLGAFDYETTGIKPQRKGHKIVCCSIADSEDHAWVFKMPKTRKGRYPFRKWLNDRSIPKMAHNMKFEDTWSNEILKVPVNGWEWDSMMAAHILNNRTGITSLKFQNYVHFGIIDYASEVSPFLKSKGGDDSGNSFNQILELLRTQAGTDSLLEYNALDSVYEYRLALKQMEELNWNFLPF